MILVSSEVWEVLHWGHQTFEVSYQIALIPQVHTKCPQLFIIWPSFQISLIQFFTAFYHLPVPKGRTRDCASGKVWKWDHHLLWAGYHISFNITSQCISSFLFNKFRSATSHQRHVGNSWSTGSLGLLHGTTVKSHIPKIFVGDCSNQCLEMYNYLH